MFYRPGNVRPMWLKPIRGKNDLSRCTWDFTLNFEKKTEMLFMSEFKMSDTHCGFQNVMT